MLYLEESVCLVNMRTLRTNGHCELMRCFSLAQTHCQLFYSQPDNDQVFKFEPKYVDGFPWIRGMWNFWVIFESFVAPSGDGSHPHLSLGAAAAARTAGRVTQLRSHPIITSTVPGTHPPVSPARHCSGPDQTCTKYKQCLMINERLIIFVLFIHKCFLFI